MTIERAGEADWEDFYGGIAEGCGVPMPEAKQHHAEGERTGFTRTHVLTDGRIGIQFCLPADAPHGPWEGPYPDAQAPVPHVADCPGCAGDEVGRRRRSAPVGQTRRKLRT